MTRRLIISLAAFLVISPTFAQQYNWIAGTAVPAEDPIAQATDMFFRLINEKTDGAVNVNVLHGAVLGGDRDQVESVLQGTLHFANPGQAIVGIWYRPAEIWTFPFLFKDVDHKNRVWDTIRDEYAAEVAEASGLRLLVSVPRPPRLLSANKAVRSPSDLRGVKIRVPETPMWVQTFVRFGASPVALPLPEVYTALQTGVIDAQENPIDLSTNYGFLEVNKFLTLTEHMIQDNVILMSESVWQSLPANIQQAIREAALETEAHFRAYWEAREAEYMERARDLGVTIIEPDKEAFVAAIEGMEAEFPHVAAWVERIREID